MFHGSPSAATAHEPYITFSAMKYPKAMNSPPQVMAKIRAAIFARGVMCFCAKASMISTVISAIMPLMKNVPYRFLSPWIPFMSNEDVVEKSNNSETRCPYSLHDDHIEIYPAWGDYFMANYEKMTEFVERELCVYLKINKQFSK